MSINKFGKNKSIQKNKSIKIIEEYQWRLSVEDFQKIAKEKLPYPTFSYYSAGSDDQITLSRNKQAFKEIKLYPRVLKDMSNLCLRTKILGHNLSLPFGMAPVAMQKLIHSKGELLGAQQCYKQGTAYGLSMLSTTGPSQILKVNPTGLKIQQLYLLNNAEYTQRFIQKVAKNNFHALALTVDTQTFGKRRVDKKNSFQPQVTLQVFKQLGIEIYFDAPLDKPQKSFIKSINTRVNWQSVKNLKKLTDKYSLKLILKGVVEPLDVQLAHQTGIDAVWISNHGGRQLDPSPAGVQSIAQIKKKVLSLNSKMEIYVDGGVLKGSDIFKCLALGADFVFLGRGFLYSLVDGSEGIHKSFEILKKDLETTMMLCGTRNISEISPEYVIYKQPISRL